MELHPDSGYNNWTIRSYNVPTKLDEIPDWMKIYSESSTSTHEFFQFERYGFDDLNSWQNMLLKLYREDLKKIISYYEEYRASIVKEIVNRQKCEKEKVDEGDERIRHKPYNRLRASDAGSPLDGLQVHSQELLNSPLLSPSPNLPIKFKRFSNKPAKPLSKSEDNLDVTVDEESHDNMGQFGNGLSFKRSVGKRRFKEYEKTTDGFVNVFNFPTPCHQRSASSRNPILTHDFPSPELARSASDRPRMLPIRQDMVQGDSCNSVTSFLSVDSNGSSYHFTRNSSKRSSGGIKVLSSPGIKKKKEPGSNHVEYIDPVPPKKGKKISKLISRAVSFGKADKKTKSPRPPKKASDTESPKIKHEDKNDVNMSRETAV